MPDEDIWNGEVVVLIYTLFKDLKKDKEWQGWTTLYSWPLNNTGVKGTNTGVKVETTLPPTFKNSCIICDSPKS